MRPRIPRSRLPFLLSAATLCGVVILCGVLLSTRTVEETNLATRTWALAVNDGNKLVAYARIVNNEGEDLNYTYHVVLSHSSGSEKEYSGTVLVRNGGSYGLAVNLYPEQGKSADVLVWICKGEAVEPFEEFTFHFPSTALAENLKSGEA